METTYVGQTDFLESSVTVANGWVAAAVAENRGRVIVTHFAGHAAGGRL